MAGISPAAGPEYQYLAPYSRNDGIRTDLDSLFFNLVVQRDNAKPDTETKIRNLQTLITKQDQRYGPHDVTRFSFARLRELAGIADLELFFYQGDALHRVPIPDEPAFQRLLLAVHLLGIAASPSPGELTNAPPVLKFFARPKPSAHNLLAAIMSILVGILILLCLVVIILLLWQLGPGPVVLGIILITLMGDQWMKPRNEHRNGNGNR